MKSHLIIASLLVATPLLVASSMQGSAVKRDDSAAESLGWRLSLQCWTMNNLTTFEAIDRAKKMGLRYIELYPGQTMRPGSKAKTRHDMSAADREELQRKLKAAGMKVVNYGVVGLSGDPERDRPVFAFARALGIETINSEPAQEKLGAIEKMAEEFGVNVALHNHPKPSRYWNPQTAYEAVSKHGPRLGLCADTGHWMRSGIDPLVALKKYSKRVLTFHFKDLNEFGKRGAHDVPWGSGVGQTKEILAYLASCGFKGVFSIEYEHHPADQLQLVAQCVKNFDQMAAAIVHKRSDR